MKHFLDSLFVKTYVIHEISIGLIDQSSLHRKNHVPLDYIVHTPTFLHTTQRTMFSTTPSHDHHVLLAYKYCNFQKQPTIHVCVQFRCEWRIEPRFLPDVMLHVNIFRFFLHTPHYKRTNSPYIEWWKMQVKITFQLLPTHDPALGLGFMVMMAVSLSFEMMKRWLPL